MDKLLERKKTFTIEGHVYEVEFPSTGGLMNIEIIKAQLSNGQYEIIASNSSTASQYSKFLIDMISVFSVLFPDLKKDMNVKSIRDLDVIHSKKLLKIYLDQVLPWFNEFIIMLSTEDETEEKTE